MQLSSRQPRVLMIAPAFAPNFFSEALVNSKLALAMVRAGWDLKVLTAPSSLEAYSKGWQEPWQVLRASSIEVTSPASSPARKAFDQTMAMVNGVDPIPSALWGVEAAKLALKLHQESPFDILLTRSTSCVAHLPAMLLRKEIQIPWIANYNDPPAFLKPDAYAEPRSWFHRAIFLRYLRRSALMADWCSFPSQRLRDYLAQAYRIDNPAKAVVLPHIGIDLPNDFTNIIATPRPDFIVTHAGNLMAEHEPVELFKGWSQFVLANASIRPRMRVFGRVHDTVRNLIEQLAPPHSVVLEEPKPFLETLSCLAQSDALLVVDVRHHGTLMLSKISDYAAMSRPIIAVAPPNSTTRDLIEGLGAGLWADNSSTTAIAAAFDSTFRTCWENLPTAHLPLQRLQEYVSPSRILEQICALAEASATHSRKRSF